MSSGLTQMAGEFAVKTEGGKRQLIINYKGSPYGADLAQYPQCMQDVITRLREVDADEVVLSEYYERIYNADQTKLLKGIADLVTRFESEAVWAPSNLSGGRESKVLASRHDAVMQFLSLLQSDFFKAYLFLVQEIKQQEARADKMTDAERDDVRIYLKTLEFLREEIERTEVIQRMKKYLLQLSGIPSDRGIYHAFFEAVIKPSFIGSRIFFTGIETLQLADQYDVSGTKVYIYKHPEKVEYLYYINPPEYTLPPEQYFLLEKTKEVVSTHRPASVTFLDMQQARKYFRKIYTATIGDLALHNGIKISAQEKDDLANIVARYTIGYGILEILLSDRQLTDVYLDSPLGEKPIYLVHSKYGQCQTNIIFSEEEAKSTVSRFRALSGRPFDEAHPILDFDLPDLQTRIAAIGKPLAVDGTAFAFRLHKETPWTLAQFLDQGMFSALGAGMLSFFVDAQASSLIVGSRGAGKTSLLQAMMQEIPQNLRIIVQEDSVTGDSEILAERDGRLEKTTVGELVDGLVEKHGCERIAGKEVAAADSEGIRVFALDAENKISLQPVSQFIRHRVSKPIFEVSTRTGRRIKVTGDHSLFTLGNFGVEPVKTREIRAGGYIAVPRVVPFRGGTAVKEISAIGSLPDSAYVVCEAFKPWCRANRGKIASAARGLGLSKGTVQNWARKGLLPVKVAKKFPELLNFPGIRFKLDRKSRPIPATFALTPEFLNFAGLWLADGCYDGKYGVVISAGEPEEVGVIDSVAGQFGLGGRLCTDGYSRIISNTGLVWALKNVFGLQGDSFTKKIPQWVAGLSDDQLAEVLKGFFSGDGYAAEYEVVTSLQSRALIKDIKTLLLRLGIVAREHGPTKQGLTSLSVSSLPMLQKYSAIGFLQARKNAALSKALARTSTHDTADVIPMPRQLLRELAEGGADFNRHDYMVRGFKVGRRKLLQVAQRMQGGHLQRFFSTLAGSDIYWDEVVSVEMVSDGKNGEFVYDLSVPGCENFVCENIIAHNTQELPVPQLKKLGFNIQRLKTRPPLGAQSDAEVSAEDALRTALRLGDSVLIVGEVRSSIRGSEEVVVVYNGVTKRMPIEELYGKDPARFQVPTLDFDLSMRLAPLTGFVKHQARNSLLEVTTETGRKVTVTHDHSLFAATRDFRIAAVECRDLKPGDSLVLPARMPCGYSDVEKLNVFELLPEFRVEGFQEPVRRAISTIGWRQATQAAGVRTGDIYNYFRTNQKSNLGFQAFQRVMQKAGQEFALEELKAVRGTGHPIPASLPVDEDFCRFLGYYVSEGYFSAEPGKGGNVILTNSDPQLLDDFSYLGRKLFGLEAKHRQVHGAGDSVQARFGSSALAALLSRLECGRTCTEKRVPPMIFGLPKRKIAAFLRGLYSGDGSFTASRRSGNAVRYFSTSRKLAEDVAYLLLAFGIVSRFHSRTPKKGNRLWIVEFKQRDMVKTFLNEIGFVQKKPQMLAQSWPHSKANAVFFDTGELRKHLTKYPRRYRHLFRFGRCSLNYLRQVVFDPECRASEQIKTYASGSVYLDRIASVKEITLPSPEPVYDLSVSPSQNFVGGFGGILLHNTEARALYEAMRVGAVGNVVMGTIHGESAYSIWDRVVNDLGVPTTSFKATDFAIVAAPIRFKGSLKRSRRLIQVTEIKKHWTEDPDKEGGMLDWMLFDAKKDDLQLFEDNIKGSEWLEKLERGRGLSREQIWAEIRARADSKQYLVDLRRKYDIPRLLEAENSIKAHTKMMLLEEQQRDERGSVEHKELLRNWRQWVDDVLAKPLMRK
ncbi:MAG: ATPase, T2SS/T4P/T4SS family [Candidatus Micrarchaeota archaeon]